MFHRAAVGALHSWRRSTSGPVSRGLGKEADPRSPGWRVACLIWIKRDARSRGVALSSTAKSQNESAFLRTFRQLLSGEDIIQLAIRLGLLGFLICWSFLLVQPFVPILAWSAVL